MYQILVQNKQQKLFQNFEVLNLKIRYAELADLDEIVNVDSTCFPGAEAASVDRLRDRLTYYPNHFWIMEDEGKIAAYVNGMVTDEKELSDEMYAKADMHNENGSWQMIFGVGTVPAYRRQGCAQKLLERAISDAKEQGRKGVVLTCKEKLIGYYSKFGFVDEGISDSTYGGAVWHKMRLTF